MIQKTNRIFKTILKFVLFGNIYQKSTVHVEDSPNKINYHMSSVFPDKKTKDESLNSLQNFNYLLRCVYLGDMARLFILTIVP